MTPDTREAVSTYMHGTAGYTPDSKHVYLGVDIRVKDWRDSLTSSVAHELNHTVRHHRMGTHRGQLNMLDTLAFEGLAQCFEKEVCGKLPPYSSPLSAQQIRKVWDVIKDELDSLDEALYRRVFFARKTRGCLLGLDTDFLIGL